MTELPPLRFDNPLAPETPMIEAATRTLFHRLQSLCEGAVIVDADARVVWMNEKYAHRFGCADAQQARGLPIETVIPNSRMREIVQSRQPIVLDIMQIGNEHAVVTRLPLIDAKGQMVGAVGFILYERVQGLRPLLERATQLQARLSAAERELSDNRRARYSLASWLGQSAAATETKRQARRAAMLQANVLLLGETGTGKELLAHAIHHLSARASRPFVSVNAAAIPESLLEAELFGAAPGAYTGADRRGRDGKFKLADGGTLFLDEIGDMPLPLQAKLLRVLQEGEIEPLGANRLLEVDVRVIAATSLDLGERVAGGRFRADLYYRLNALEIRVPPLRERLQDLPLMVERMLDEIGTRLGQPLELQDDALQALQCHAWPGNVRELRNVLERLVMLNETTRLDARHVAAVLPPILPPVVPSAAHRGAALAAATPSLADAVARAERQAIEDALAASQGNKAQAAKALGISRAALYDKLAMLGLSARPPTV